MKIATIDIGSNGTKLLIQEVVLNKQKFAEFNKIAYLRLPLRLGLDVFETGVISPSKEKKINEAIQLFQSLLKFYDVKFLKTCATSAMREATNQQEIIQRVLQQTGVKIDILSVDEEITLIYENHSIDELDKKHAYLYINVSGGATDLILVINGNIKYKASFDIGTVRILKNLVKNKHFEKMQRELKNHVKSPFPILAVGSGGNINEILLISKVKKGENLTLKMTKEYYKELSGMSVEERMHTYDLSADRAEVLVGALKIYINVMTWVNANELYVPKIDLAHGLAHAFYQELVNATL